MSHNRFRRVSWLRKGYHPRQVDAFLDQVEVSLSGALPPPTTTEIRRAGFELVHHGYVSAAVDAHLDGLEDRALGRQQLMSGRRGRSDPAGDVIHPREELVPPGRQIARVRPWRRGYTVAEVDEVLDRINGALGGALEGATRLSPAAVRRVTFSRTRGGYQEDTVDELLDRVIELLLWPRSTEGPTSVGGPSAPR